MKPFEQRPKTPERERRLREIPSELRKRPDDQPAPALPTSQNMDTLFDGIAFQMNRATALIQVLEPRLSKKFIPIDPDALPVKNAVRRQLKQSKAEQIPFDLYKNLLDRMVRDARKLRFQVLGDFSGDPLTDAKKIARHVKSGGKGLSQWEEFLLAMEPWLVWFLLNQLIGQFQCQEHKEACAAKQPAGSEDTPLLQRYAISIAAMMLIMGLQEDHILFALDRPGQSLPMPAGQVIDRARRLIDSDGLHRELVELVGATDPQLIVDYCDRYIRRHPLDYEEWMAYRDMRDIRQNLQVTYVHAHMYSPGHRELLYYEYTNVHQTPTASGGGIGSFLFGGGGRQVRIENASTPMSSSQYEATVQHLNLADRSISAVGGVLTSGFTQDLLCCIGRFLGSKDAGKLRAIRKILRLSMGMNANGLPNGGALANPGGLLDWVTAAIQNEIIASLNRLIDKEISDVLGDIYNIDDGDLEALLYCPLVGDLLYALTEAASDLKWRLNEMIRSFTIHIEGLHSGVFSRWASYYDLRRQSTILAILDRVIAAVEQCAEWEPGQGGEPVPNPGEDPTILAAVPKPLQLPPEVVERFFSNSLPVRREGVTTRDIPPVGKLTTLGDEQITAENYKQFCKGILPDDLLAAINRRNRA